MDNDAKGLQRSGLAGVLGALTGTSQCAWGPWIVETNGVRLFVYAAGAHATFDQAGGGVVAFAPGPWITTDPREALEILQTRGLAPEDDARRGFACAMCKGSGETMGDGGAHWDGACFRCLATGSLQVPVTIPDLIAWASLGIPAILRAEELARETVVRLREWGCPQPERVVWRVGERRAGGIDTSAREDARQPTPDGWPHDVNNMSDARLFWKHSNTGASWWDCHAKAWTDPRPCPYDGMIALAAMGLWVDSITADAVTLVVPPIGGAR